MTLQRIGLLGGSLAALSLIGGAAHAQGSDADADVRCLVVTSVMSKSDEPTAKTYGQIGAAYYLGKLDGRDPKLDLENRLVAEGVKMKTDGAAAASEAQRCLAALAARAGDLTAMGDRVTKRVEAAPAHP
jgi:hypothetical protein